MAVECISRKAAIDHVYDCCMESSSCNMNCIKDIPAADVKPVVHGKWIELGKYSDGYDWRCSVCKRESVMAVNYCPFCGADMRDNTQKTSVDEEVKHG